MSLGVSVSVVFDHDVGAWVATSTAHEIEVFGDTQHDAFWGLMRKITEVAERRRGVIPIRQGAWKTGAEQRAEWQRER